MTASETIPEGVERILVIKLSALGDFVQALGPMQAIRRTWPQATITLLTTKPYRRLAEAAGLFNDILIDDRPPPWDLPNMMALRRRLKALDVDMVFDLQTSDRSTAYRHLLLPDRPFWCGLGAGASHAHVNPARDRMHTVERQADQLARAGITDVRPSDLSFLEDAADPPDGLPRRFALLVPGGAPHRPEKRWPGTSFGEIGTRLAGRGITPVVIGTQAEAEAAAAIKGVCPQAISLIGGTDLLQLGPLARRAVLAIGNDTGPMHIIASSDCPSLVLYSHASDPALCGQRGSRVAYLRVPDLDRLPVDDVWPEVEALLEGKTAPG